MHALFHSLPLILSNFLTLALTLVGLVLARDAYAQFAFFFSFYFGLVWFSSVVVWVDPNAATSHFKNSAMFQFHVNHIAKARWHKTIYSIVETITFAFGCHLFHKSNAMCGCGERKSGRKKNASIKATDIIIIAMMIIIINPTPRRITRTIATTIGSSFARTEEKEAFKNAKRKTNKMIHNARTEGVWMEGGKTTVANGIYLF